MDRAHQTLGIPSGLHHNPSAWSRRIPVALLALLGFGIALYLALYQWKFVPTVWEPFFGDGSIKILNSPLSELLPIPDAALGAIAYFLEAALDLVGGRNRWRTSPWSVLLFGTFASVMGLGSIILVLLQAFVFKEWCTLCLASAGISVFILRPALMEFWTAWRHLLLEYRRGCSLWESFWGLQQGSL